MGSEPTATRLRRSDCVQVWEVRLAPESLSVGLSGALVGVLAGLLESGLPGAVLFEGLVALAGIAGAVGEGDVVDVVLASA